MSDTPNNPEHQSGQKKGLGPLAWIAIGCVGILLLGAVLTFACTAMVAKKAKDIVEEAGDNPGMAAAEMMIRLNPDLELVSKDEDAQTITVHDQSTGKTMTVSLDQVMQGKIGVESDEGTIDFDATGGIDGSISARTTTSDGETTDFSIGAGAAGQLPDWVPNYKNSEVTVPFISAAGGRVQGAAAFATNDSLDEVAAALTRDLEGQNFKVERSSFAAADTSMVMLTCEGPDGQTLNVSLNEREGQTHASMNFSG